MNTKFLKRFGLLALLPVLLPSSAHGATDWSGWWLPHTYSTHAPDIDSLFVWIFWITTVTFVVVELMLVIFLIKYRFNPNKKKAVFTHGNQRLEMCWTITPAIILLVLALFSKRVWDNYRYSDYANSPDKVTLLVVGQQFKWNTIYPGPDGKLGTYLSYPKPTDTKWPDTEHWKREKAKKEALAAGKPAPAEKPFMFKGVPGPAFLPYEKAVKAINDFNETNPQGKDFNDPNGEDDLYEGALAREIVLPAHRPIEVQLSSKDVIHDFFLPNYRVKLDAVPGMRGLIYFDGLKTSREMEEDPELGSGHKHFKLDGLADKLSSPEMKDLVLEIDPNSPFAYAEPNAGTGVPALQYTEKPDAKGKRAIIARGGSPLSSDVIAKLQKAGFTEVVLYKPFVWELVCEELCGQGHNTMRGQLRFVTSEEYDALKLDKPRGSVATTQPSVAMAKMP